MKMNLVNTAFISYGLGSYNPELFVEIKNRDRFPIKPNGGLWSSPKESKYGWKDFCLSGDYRLPDGFINGFEFYLEKDSKVYIIDSFYDLISVPYKVKFIEVVYSPVSQTFIDFESMAKEYDAILLTEKGQSETRLPEMEGLYDLDGSWLNLYGWDCESLLVLNKSCIINVRDLDKSELPDIETGLF